MNVDGENHVVQVRRAPEPSDIKWENCGASNSAKVGKRLSTWSVTFILLGCCFGLIYLINLWQVKINGYSLCLNQYFIFIE